MTFQDQDDTTTTTDLALLSLFTDQVFDVGLSQSVCPSKKISLETLFLP